VTWFTLQKKLLKLARALVQLVRVPEPASGIVWFYAQMAASSAHEEAMGSPADGLPVSQHWSLGSNAYAAAIVNVETAQTAVTLLLTISCGMPVTWIGAAWRYWSALETRPDDGDRRAAEPSSLLRPRVKGRHPTPANSRMFAWLRDRAKVVLCSIDVVLESKCLRAVPKPEGIDLACIFSAKSWQCYREGRLQ
jgi:hypothetical protein